MEILKIIMWVYLIMAFICFAIGIYNLKKYDAGEEEHKRKEEEFINSLKEK